MVNGKYYLLPIPEQRKAASKLILATNARINLYSLFFIDYCHPERSRGVTTVIPVVVARPKL